MEFFYFLTQILSQILRNVSNKTNDNHDFSRFPQTAFSESKFRYFKNKIRDSLLWLLNTMLFFIHINQFFKSYHLLCDQESKDLFIRLVVFKILGSKCIQIKPNHDWNHEKKLIDAANEFYVNPSQISLKPHPWFDGLNHYQNIPTEGDNITLDCWAGGIIYPGMKGQYYFSRHNIVIKPENGDVVIDGGGCFGDTSIFFAKSVGKNGMVYVFDPLPTHGTVIHKNIAQNNLQGQVIYLPYAISEASNFVEPTQDFNQPLNPGFRLPDNNTFPIMSIDDFVLKNNVNIINFIKMDIEGHELLALKGAIETIKKFMPKLAISIYHRREDFYAIPLWLNQITDGYNYYIDHYTMHAEETVLYAIPKH